MVLLLRSSLFIISRAPCCSPPPPRLRHTRPRRRRRTSGPLPVCFAEGAVACARWVFVDAGVEIDEEKLIANGLIHDGTPTGHGKVCVYLCFCVCVCAPQTCRPEQQQQSKKRMGGSSSRSSNSSGRRPMQLWGRQPPFTVAPRARTVLPPGESRPEPRRQVASSFTAFCRGAVVVAITAFNHRRRIASTRLLLPALPFVFSDSATPAAGPRPDGHDQQETSSAWSSEWAGKLKCVGCPVKTVVVCWLVKETVRAGVASAFVWLDLRMCGAGIGPFRGCVWRVTFDKRGAASVPSARDCVSVHGNPALAQVVVKLQLREHWREDNKDKKLS